MKSNIWTSSSNIFQLVTLSGMEFLCKSLTEKVSRERPSSGMILDVVFSKRYASKFCDLGKNLMLKDLNELMMSLTNF